MKSFFDGGIVRLHGLQIFRVRHDKEAIVQHCLYGHAPGNHGVLPVDGCGPRGRSVPNEPAAGAKAFRSDQLALMNVAESWTRQEHGHADAAPSQIQPQMLGETDEASLCSGINSPRRARGHECAQ